MKIINPCCEFFVTLMLQLNKQLGFNMQLDRETHGFISSGHWCTGLSHCGVICFGEVFFFFNHWREQIKARDSAKQSLLRHFRRSQPVDFVCTNCQNGTVLQLKASLAASLPAVVKGCLMEGNKRSRSILCQVSDHHDWSRAGPRLGCQGFPSSAEALPMLLFVCICVYCRNFWM